MRRVVLMICDGHRADFVRPEMCPNLYNFADRARRFDHHSAIFPSATRASAASIATGCFPASHGLHGNSMGLPDKNGYLVFDVGAPSFLDEIRTRLGRTLRVPTMAERLKNLGGVIVGSNVSPGAAYFHDPDHHGHVLHRAGAFGPGGQILSGEQWPVVSHDATGDSALTDWFCQTVLGEMKPALAVLWLADPDLSMHADLLGSPTHLAGVAAADRCFARVRDAVDRLNAAGDEVLFIVGSDHGQESVGDLVPVEELMITAGLKAAPGSSELVIAPQGASGLVYLSDASRTDAVADWLRAQPFIAAVFAGEAMRSIGQAPADGLAIAFAMAHSDAPNANGVPGRIAICTSGSKPGKPEGFGSHGGIGRYETHPFLMIAGGGFAPGSVETRPSSLVDLAPTILDHLGVVVDGMDGRPLAKN